MDKKRIQFDFSGEALQELDQLRALTGFSSRADLIRHALRFLHWTVQQTKSGNVSLVLSKDGVQREVLFPFWGAEFPAAEKENEVTTISSSV